MLNDAAHQVPGPVTACRLMGKRPFFGESNETV